MSVPPDLTAAEKADLLALARQRIAQSFGGREVDPAEPPVLARRAGAFVTVRVGKDLRGCIGIPEPSTALSDVVAHCAEAAAFEDPRFPSIRDDELDALHVEISVLSPLRVLTDPASIEIGRHGLVVERGWHRGLLLPQVAAEHHWSAFEFLRQTCRKAGLPPDAWQHGATVWTFEADVFGDT